MPTRTPEEFLIDQPAPADVAEAGEDHYAGLRHELGLLDEALAHDENWRALAQLDEREARGEPLEAVAGEKLRAMLLGRLSQSRIYQAHGRVAEALAILEGRQQLPPLAPEPGPADQAEKADDSEKPGDTDITVGAPADKDEHDSSIDPDAGSGEGEQKSSADSTADAFRVAVKVKSKSDFLIDSADDQDPAKDSRQNDADDSPEGRASKDVETETSVSDADEAGPATAATTAEGGRNDDGEVNQSLSPAGLANIDPGDDVIEQLASWRYEPSPPEPAEIGPQSEDTGNTAAIAGAAGVIAAAAATVMSARTTAEVRPDKEPDNDASSVQTAPVTAVVSVGESQPAVLPDINDDHLELIHRIDKSLAERLRNEDGVGLAKISRWTIDDVVEISRKYDLGLKVASQGWIEQAAHLTSGRYTTYAERQMAHDYDALVASPPPLPPPAKTPPVKIAVPAETASAHEQAAAGGDGRADETISRPPAEEEAETAAPAVEAVSAAENDNAAEQADADRHSPLKSVEAANVLAGLALATGVATAAKTLSTTQEAGTETPPQSEDKRTSTDETADAPVADTTGELPRTTAAPVTADNKALAQEATTETPPSTEQSPKTAPIESQSDYTGDFLSRHYVAKPVIPAAPVESSVRPSPESTQSAGSDVADKSSAFAAPRRDSAATPRGGGVFEAGKPDATARNPERKSAIVQSRIPQTYEPGSFEEEAEVVIVAREPSEEDLLADKARAAEEASRPALGRINKNRDERETGIESHAAYRMETDEASVVIVHRDKGEEAPDLPFYKQNEQYEREGTIRKFLKALTGD